MTRVADIMSSCIKAVRPETTLRELAEFFIDDEVTGAPVMSGSRVVGVVSASDLVEFDYEGAATGGAEVDRAEAEAWDLDPGRDDPDAPDAYFLDLWESAGRRLRDRFATIRRSDSALDTRSAGDVMTRRIVSVAPDDDVREAAARMIEHGVRRVLVLEGGELAGILTMTDIVQAVADRGLA